MVSTTQDSESKPRAITRRFFRGVLIILVFLALLVWFAPTLVAVTPLRHWVAQRIFAGLKGSIKVGNASLGWFSPVIAENVQFHDPQGKEYLTVPRVQSEYTLLRLLMDLSDLGPFHCENPTVKVILAGNKSNLEEVLTGYLEPDTKGSASATPGIELQVSGAKLEMVDKDLGKTWRFEPIHCDIRIPKNPGGTLQVKVDGQGKVQATKFQAELELPAWQKIKKNSGEPGKLHVETEAFPLAMLAPILRRFDSTLKLEGSLDTALKVAWTGELGQPTSGFLEGTVKIGNLDLQSSFLDKETLRLKEVKLPCKVHIQGNQIEIAKAELHCDCGQATMRGKWDMSGDWKSTFNQPGCEIEANLDLPRLAALLPKTLRLRADTKLTEGQVKLVLQSKLDKRTVQWSGDLQTSRLVGVNQGKAFSAPELIALNFLARISEQGIPLVEKLNCKSSFLMASASSSGTQWDIQARYDLDQLVKQLSQFVDFGSLKLGGKGEILATFRGEGKQVECLQSKLTVNHLVCEVPGFSIKEPALQLKSAGTLDMESGKLELANAQLYSETLTMTVPKLQVLPVRGGGFEVTTSAAVKADLQRLHRWLPGAATNALPLAGKLLGTISLNTKGPRTTGNVDLTIANFVAGEPKSPYWTEPILGFRGRAVYDQLEDSLDITQLNVDGAGLQCDTTGKLAKVMGNQDLSLAGKVHYDMEKLELIWNLYIGPGVKLVGKGTGPLQLKGSLTGPVWSAASKPGPAAVVTGPFSRLQGQVTLGWKSGNLYGLDCGPADVHLSLSKGWLQTPPIQTHLSQGTLRLHPYARLEPAPMELFLAKGKTIDHAKITPKISSSALKYALPALAGMTEGDGAFSVDLEGGRIPLENSHLADISGQIIIHQARIGASPLIHELALLFKAPAQAKLAQESVVPFRLVNGRVYHQKLELVFPELTICTSGSVGLDGSLDLVAEFPVPPKWLGSSKISQALAKQTIALPLRGNLSQPQLDRQALAAASKNILENTAKDLLQQEINNKLKKIFGPK